MSDADPNVRAFYQNENFKITSANVPKDLPVDLEDLLNRPAVKKNVLARRGHLFPNEHTALCRKISGLDPELRRMIFRELAARRLPSLPFFQHWTTDQTIHDAVRDLLPDELEVLREEAHDEVSKVVHFKMTVDLTGDVVFNQRKIKSTHPGIVRLDITIDYPNKGRAIASINRHLPYLQQIFPTLKILQVALKQKFLVGGDVNGEQPDPGRYLENSCNGVIAALLKAQVREKWISSSHRETFKTCFAYMEKGEVESQLKKWNDGEEEQRSDIEGVLGLLVSRFDVWIPVEGLGQRKKGIKVADG